MTASRLLLAATAWLGLALPAAAWELGYEYRVLDTSVVTEPRNSFEKNTPESTYFGFDPLRGAIGFSMPLHGFLLRDESGAAPARATPSPTATRKRPPSAG